MSAASKVVNMESAQKRLAFQKSYSVEHGENWRRRSLIEDARFDTATNAEFLKQERSSRNDRESISEEDERTHTDTPANFQHDSVRKMSIIFSLNEGISSLHKILRCFENYKIQINHIESRIPSNASVHTEIIMQTQGTRSNFVPLLNALKQNNSLIDIKFMADENEDEQIWFPTHISHLDDCQHLMTQFEPELDIKHPGFTDKDYLKRRQEITEIAFKYKHGEAIPRVEYNNNETKTWETVYQTIRKLGHVHACREYNAMFDILEKEGIFSAREVPQLEDVSKFLQRQTGFSLRPVAGLLTARDFLASLAFRVFQCTQYLRHHSKPDHTPEPDLVHEMLGHVPMLANPGFARFSQELGLASLGVSDSDIEKFATLYWFTIEFGLIKQNGALKVIGAAILSSYGEMTNAMSEKVEKHPFDPDKTALQSYTDLDFQPILFVAESVDDMKEKMRCFTTNIKRPYEVRYNPFNQSVEILNDKARIEDTIADLHREIRFVERALGRINALDLR